MDNRKPRIHEIEVIAGHVGYGKSAEVNECGVHAEYSERVRPISRHPRIADIGYTLRILVEWHHL